MTHFRLLAESAPNFRDIAKSSAWRGLKKSGATGLTVDSQNLLIKPERHAAHEQEQPYFA